VLLQYLWDLHDLPCWVKVPGPTSEPHNVPQRVLGSGWVRLLHSMPTWVLVYDASERHCPNGMQRGKLGGCEDSERVHDMCCRDLLP
jgi:hypothetical protein